MIDRRRFLAVCSQFGLASTLLARGSLYHRRTGADGGDPPPLPSSRLASRNHCGDGRAGRRAGRCSPGPRSDFHDARMRSISSATATRPSARFTCRTASLPPMSSIRCRRTRPCKPGAKPQNMATRPPSANLPSILKNWPSPTSRSSPNIFAQKKSLPSH